MTHQLYTEHQLQAKSLSELKTIYSQIGATVEVADKRAKSAWVIAIVAHQASQVEKVDEQAVAQAELNTEIVQEVEAIKDVITAVEISFYEHEIYAKGELIADIWHDEKDFVTERWVVMIGDKEIHRANTYAKCFDFVRWHHKQSTLPKFNTPAPVTTGNEVMAQIATECDRFGVELMEDGIYQGDVKLGEVGCTDGRWWAVRASSPQQLKVPCDSAFDAVWGVWIIGTTKDEISVEGLLDMPFDELTQRQWEWLKEREFQEETELVAA